MAGPGKTGGYLQTCLGKKSEAPRPDPVDDGINSSNFLPQRQTEKARPSPLAFIPRRAARGPSDLPLLFPAPGLPRGSMKSVQLVTSSVSSCLATRWEIIALNLCSHAVMKTPVRFNENHRPGHESCGLSDVCAQLCRNTEALGA